MSSCPDLFHCCPVQSFRGPAPMVGNVPPPSCHPGLVSLLSGLNGLDRAKGIGTSGFPTDRLTRDTDFGALASLPPSCPDLFRASTSCGMAVRAWSGRGGGGTWMPGTSPGMTTRRGVPEDADTARPCPRPSARSPRSPEPDSNGLVPGSKATAPFSPGFPRIGVRGRPGPRHKAGVTAGETTGDAGAPKSVSRVERSSGTPLVPMPFARSARIKPDSSGHDGRMVADLRAPLRPRQVPALFARRGS